MELFSFPEAGSPLLLCASENGLSLYPVHNERFGHPLLLCSGYKSGFSGCIYNTALHYAYINKENALLLRRLHDSTPLFRLESNATVTCRNPQLIVFNHTLFLFFLEEAPDAYRLKLRLPFTDKELQLPEPLTASFSALPKLRLMTAGQSLYLFLTAGECSVSYRYTKADRFEPLCSEEELLSRLRLPWEAEEAQLKQTILQAIHLSEQQQALLTEKEQGLKCAEARIGELTAEAKQTNTLLSETGQALQDTKQQLKACEESRQQALKNLEHTSLLLERAKAQYSELMQVAEQYRQEALKWYGKFTDRN